MNIVNEKKAVWVIRPGALGDSLLLAPLLQNLLLDGFAVFVSGTFPHLEVLKILFPEIQFLRFDDGRHLKLFSYDFDEADCLGLIGSKPFCILNFLNADADLDGLLQNCCEKYSHMSLREKGDDSIAQQAYTAFYGNKKMDWDFLSPFRAGQKKGVLLHFGSGTSKKLLPEKSVERLVDLISLVFAGAIKILLGPSDQLYFSNKNNFEVIQSNSGAELCEVMGNNETYFGFDSGVSHLAGLLGLKGCVFFHSSQIKYWAPLGQLRSVDFFDFKALDEQSSLAQLKKWCKVNL